jgi:hypothetical protein
VPQAVLARIRARLADADWSDDLPGGGDDKPAEGDAPTG